MFLRQLSVREAENTSLIFLHPYLAGYSILLLLLLGSCRPKSVTYELVTTGKSSIKEDSLVLKKFPSKIIYINDSCLALPLSEGIVLLNPRNGNMNKVVRINAHFKSNELLYRFLHLDTNGEAFKSMARLKLNEYGSGPSLQNMTSVSDTELYLLFTVSYPEIEAENTDTTVISNSFTYFACRYHILSDSFSHLMQTGLNNDTTVRYTDVPLSSFFVLNNYVYIGQFNADPFHTKQYPILRRYDLNSLKYIDSVPVFYQEQQTEKWIQEHGYILHLYSWVAANGHNYIENEEAVYDLATCKPVLNMRGFEKEPVLLNFFYPLDKAQKEWLVNYRILPSFEHYVTAIIQPNRVKKILSGMPTSLLVWGHHPGGRLFYCISKEKEHYYITTYQLKKNQP